MQFLGKDCHDIDVAVDNMLGREFRDKINEYRKFIGEEEQVYSEIRWHLKFFSYCHCTLVIFDHTS